jgi:hypothetical protein
MRSVTSRSACAAWAAVLVTGAAVHAAAIEPAPFDPCAPAGGLAQLVSNAQATGVQPFHLSDYEFLERQYIFASPNPIRVNGHDYPLALEAQVGPHLALLGKQFGTDDPVASCQSSYLSRAAWRGPLNHQIRLLFTFLVDLRMLAANSAPVVTPSFMPRFRIQWLARRALSPTSAGNPSKDLRFGLTLDLWDHHSNGQDGCSFLPLGDRADSKCTNHADAKGINERNGSFGTNYVGLNGHVRYSWNSPDVVATCATGCRNEAQTWNLLFSGGVQHHHEFPIGGLGDDFRALWGTWHEYLEGEVRWNPNNETESAGYGYGRVRVDHAGGGRDPQFPDLRVPSNLWAGEMGWISRTMFNLGFFIRAMSGREYYNIEFTQNVKRIQIGVTIDSTGHIPSLEGRSSRSGRPSPPPDHTAASPPPRRAPTVAAPPPPSHDLPPPPPREPPPPDADTGGNLSPPGPSP